MEAILVDCVNHSLRHFMHRNAIFMCERLCAEFPSETNLQLLAGCYLQNNQAYAAYHILKGTQMAQSRYLFAISCFQMDLLNEAEAALCPTNEPGLEVPNGAPGHYLLGLIYRYTDRSKSAIHHFKQALSIDPLFWAAYEELCILGAAEEAAAVFDEAAALCIQKQHMNHASASQNLSISNEDRNLVSARNFGLEDGSPRQSKHPQGNNLRDIPGNYHGATTLGGSASHHSNGGLPNLSFYNTPSPMVTQLSSVAPPPLCRNMQPNGSNPSMPGFDNSARSTVNSNMQAPRRKFVDEGKLRKISGRLFSDSGPRRSTRLAAEAGANQNTSSTLVAGNGTNNSPKYLGGSKLSSLAIRSVTVRKGQSWVNENYDEGIRNEAFDDSRANNTSSNCSPSLTGDSRSLETEVATMPVGGVIASPSCILSGALEILGLLRTLGEGYRLSCMYRCQDALDVYMKLPHKHYNTGWVLCQVGKAYVELVDYLEADRAFSLARRASPYSLEGLDVYSTVLYHLKEDMKLSYLAQELISTDRLAPQSWCAIGNCYSLQKDHETALKNFQRAVQLDSRFAYAHTLCGHEYVALEDFEKGIKSYQSALRIDARHYKSWHGLGMVYLRQEKNEFSEHHFRMAFQINPCSSVIMSYLGTALHALKRNEEALEMMERAILADKKNPLPMYQKANILVSLESFGEALEVLKELKEYAPRESSVYALMGRIYKRRNIHDEAMLHFGLALDLKPSATDVATIKAAIEKLHVPDELEDSL
ncbi:PREDICTED: cell division cycle protein 27 homolog B isoform X2 [Populus euphratica]|uniref:Cell division cycle protein 27 homolog B isoform X2 n=1 Tax=Populus euphratica TaxID=75702 RepID=A0AAJ6YAR1_POPEU|nr:PREDICTED: cell division cycle protein 27 homolog B isoform X2 [Populus euphratica]